MSHPKINEELQKLLAAGFLANDLEVHVVVNHFYAILQWCLFYPSVEGYIPPHYRILKVLPYVA